MKRTEKRLRLYALDQELQEKVARVSSLLLEGGSISKLTKEVASLREQIATISAEPDFISCDLCQASIDADNGRYCYTTVRDFSERVSPAELSRGHLVVGDGLLVFCIDCATKLKGEEL